MKVNKDRKVNQRQKKFEYMELEDNLFLEAKMFPSFSKIMWNFPPICIKLTHQHIPHPQNCILEGKEKKKKEKYANFL